MHLFLASFSTRTLDMLQSKACETCNPLQSSLLQMNTHPVRVALLLKAHPALLANLDRVTRALELMSDREFKDRRDVNEVLSLKFHMIHYIVKDIKKQVRDGRQSSLDCGQ